MRFRETVMGIPMSIDIRDDRDAAPAAERAFAVLRAADRRFSPYLPSSELSRANAGEPVALSDDFREVVAIGEAAARASGGAFRIRRPDGSWDLDGVVKGWAAARAARELAADGLRDYSLNAGGDVVVAGSPGDGALWNVGIRSPHDPAAMLAVLALTDGAVATSGAYERGSHIVDGRDDSPAGGLLSATVIADDLTTADVLATAVFALGADGLHWAIEQGARGVLAMDAAGRILGVGELPFARPAAAG
ncbi:FAD:protein FMN transferase [Leifsonia shinshuensis]|uniref:FAD:protein FMN transferase n=1 Tax=Leifsonia shinshuensis TaxID=150026 RepID=UPI00286072E5|nr:FAD:protein FMN transferase [Leifsonia shinshuensis]MDR6972366.1 thiamine biosynthesis lipoprotein [Leifsonia shinshuensis]